MNTIQAIYSFIYKKVRVRTHPIVTLFLVSLFIAVLAHLFFMTERLEGRYMTGIGDGLSQMLPFKKLLYDSYTSGNFFYSNQFGMGGGTYSQLGYYFSTSIIFLITTAITFILEKINVIQNPDLFYWANLILVISIIRMSLIIMVTTLYFQYINLKGIPAFVGAVLYGTSVIYFRHVTYWEFFADAMLWLPLLLLGIEKIMRMGKSSLFMIAVSISLFDNFYFAYINFLVAGIYIICRWFIPFVTDEVNKVKQIKKYIWSGIFGFGISAVSFIPAVYGYFNNHRLSYSDPIDIFGMPDHLLADSRIVVLPAFVLLCLFISPFYKNSIFRLFALLTILSIILHFSPLVASAFNGFSAPQYRWEYFLSLMAGGVAATALQHIQWMKRKPVIIAGICALSLYVASIGLYGSFGLTGNQLLSFKVAYLPIIAVITIITVILFVCWKSRKTFTVMVLTIITTSICVGNIYQMVKLPNGGSNKAVSETLMKSDAYSGDDQLELIQAIKEQEKDPFYRIDWMIPTRNNTPIVQDFNGFSVYSSILNKHLLYYYLYDLEIDMGRESTSRYGTLGDRANLHSILSGKYYITLKGQQPIPYGFREIASAGKYVAYQNMNILPFVRTTNYVFSEDDLINAPAITKEQAMIKGIILNESAAANKNLSIIENENIINDTTIDTIGSTYENGQLEVMDKSGGLDLIIKQPKEHTEDYYVSFSLKRLDKNEGYRLSVNEYQTSRKKNTSIYRTGINKLVIRVSANKHISIRVPKGIYELSDLELYEENYHLLESAKEENKLLADTPFEWSGNTVNIAFQNDMNEQYMLLPIPYEKGWHVTINGQKGDILKANYAFIGLEIQGGLNEIKLTYHPPYFFLSLAITLLTLTFVCIFIVFYRPKQNTLQNI